MLAGTVYREGSAVLLHWATPGAAMNAIRATEMCEALGEL